LLPPECTKLYFGWAPPQTPLGELRALPQTPKLDLRGPTSKGREGSGREGEREGKEGARKRKGEGREGKAFPLL